MIGSVAQAIALFFYLFFTSLPSLYVISAMFGLFQGGIVPSYAIIVRETMPANEAATRVGIVIFASVLGMSFGGWVSGVIFDMTGSYAAAFANGFVWNLVNVVIVLMLLLRSRRRLAAAQAALTLLNLAAGLQPAFKTAEIFHVVVAHVLERLADQRGASARRAIGDHGLGAVERLVVQRGSRIGAKFHQSSWDGQRAWDFAGCRHLGRLADVEKQHVGAADQFFGFVRCDPRHRGVGLSQH